MAMDCDDSHRFQWNHGFPWISMESIDFHRFALISNRIQSIFIYYHIFSHVSPYFPLFSNVSHIFQCFPLFSNVFPCFPRSRQLPSAPVSSRQLPAAPGSSRQTMFSKKLKKLRSRQFLTTLGNFRQLPASKTRFFSAPGSSWQTIFSNELAMIHVLFEKERGNDC